MYTLVPMLFLLIQLRECWTSVVCNTLLELYLTGGEVTDKSRRDEKALHLLQNPQAQYDVDHALMLSRTCDFRAGILYLYERTGL